MLDEMMKTMGKVVNEMKEIIEKETGKSVEELMELDKEDLDKELDKLVGKIFEKEEKPPVKVVIKEGKTHTSVQVEGGLAEVLQKVSEAMAHLLNERKVIIKDMDKLIDTFANSIKENIKGLED